MTDIKSLIESKGLTIKEVANRCDTSTGTIYAICNGKKELTSEWSLKIANALGISIEDFVGVIKFKFQHFKHAYMGPTIDECDIGSWTACLDEAEKLLNYLMEGKEYSLLGKHAAKYGEIKEWLEYTSNSERDPICILPYPQDYRMEYVYVVKIDHGGIVFFFADFELLFSGIELTEI